MFVLLTVSMKSFWDLKTSKESVFLIVSSSSLPHLTANLACSLALFRLRIKNYIGFVLVKILFLFSFNYWKITFIFKSFCKNYYYLVKTIKIFIYFPICDITAQILMYVKALFVSIPVISIIFRAFSKLSNASAMNCFLLK